MGKASFKAQRIYAFIVDIIISNFIGLLFFSIFDIDKDVKTRSFDSLDGTINYGISLQIVVFLLYNLTFDIVNKGVTFGKLVFSIKIVSAESAEETAIPMLMLRTMLKMLSTIFIPISAVVYLYSGVTIHERFSSTKTVSSPKR